MDGQPEYGVVRKRILKSLRKIFGRGKKQSGSEQTAQNYEILFVFEDILYIKEIVKSGSPTKTFEIHEGARLLCLSRSKPLRDRTYAIDISRCETAIRLRECNRHEFFLDCLLNTLPTTTDEIRVSELRPDIGDSRFPATLWKLNEKVAVPALDVRVALPHQLGSLELIHEAAPMNLGHPILICVIRNEAQLLDKFIDHYRALGIKNFIFIDNESTDDSVATCQRKSNNDIAIFSTSEIYREARLSLSLCQ